MKALLLAAGYGSRLGDVTKKRPKPMIKVGGKPIISHIIDNLLYWGVETIIVNLHYKDEIVTSALKGRAIYYYEPDLLGHDGTIWSLRDFLEGSRFFVINGDTISNVNFNAMQRQPDGKVIALMDSWRCAGTWLYPSNYFQLRWQGAVDMLPYRPIDLVWHDCGTPERLKVARKYYENLNGM